MTQLSLLGRAVRVRPTSMAARHSISRNSVSRVQAAILRAVSFPRTDEQIYEWLRSHDFIVSPSGARTRRSELVRAGKVECAGTIKNSRGLTVTLWRLA